MQTQNPEPFRRPSGRRARRKTNAIANLMQVLRRGEGQPWGSVKRSITGHPRHADPASRNIVRGRLRTLVCLPNRGLRPFHEFYVDEHNILRRVDDAPFSA